MFQIILKFFQTGEIEFGRIFRLCYILFKLCLYIPFAYLVVDHILSPVISLKPVEQLFLILFILTLISIVLEYSFLMWIIPKKEYSSDLESLRNLCRDFCRTHKIESGTDFYGIIPEVFKKLIESGFPKKTVLFFLVISLLENLIIMPAVVLIVFKFFFGENIIYPMVISIIAPIPFILLFYSIPTDRTPSEGEWSDSPVSSIKLLLSVPVSRKRRGTLLALLFFALFWFPFLRMKDIFPKLRIHIFTITTRDLEECGYTKLVGWFYLFDEKQAKLPLHQKSIQEKNLETENKSILEILGYIVYKRLRKPFQDSFGVVLENEKGGLIYIRNKYKNDLTPEDKSEIFYNYFNWVQHNLSSFENIQRYLEAVSLKLSMSLKLSIESFSKLDPNAFPILFKYAVPEYYRFSDYYNKLFEEEIIKSLGDLGKRTLFVLPTFKVERKVFEILSKHLLKGGRSLQEKITVFFVLPVVYVYALDK
jgi:hypothetical protein